MAIQPDGKILLGYVSTPQGRLSATEILLRYNADGTPDTTFGTGGTASVASNLLSTFMAGISLAVEPDGKILVVVTPSSGAGTTVDAGTTLLRANTDGSVDTSFGTDGMDTISLPAYPAPASARSPSSPPAG